MAGIVRTPTQEERDTTPTGTDGNSTGFIPLVDPGKKGYTAEEKFVKDLQTQEKEATKKGLPFARHVARVDFNDYFEEQAKVSMRKNGYVKAEEIKPIDIEWTKYSDLKNFEVVEERERNDEMLSKRYQKHVNLKVTKYKFKGFSYIYTVMEDPNSAINRAK